MCATRTHAHTLVGHSCPDARATDGGHPLHINNNNNNKYVTLCCVRSIAMNLMLIIGGAFHISNICFFFLSFLLFSLFILAYGCVIHGIGAAQSANVNVVRCVVVRCERHAAERLVVLLYFNVL